jgi:hypothetical protein
MKNSIICILALIIVLGINGSRGQEKEKKPDGFLDINWGESADVVKRKMLKRIGVKQSSTMDYSKTFSSDNIPGLEEMHLTVTPIGKEEKTKSNKNTKVMVFEGGLYAEEQVETWALFIGNHGFFDAGVMILDTSHYFGGDLIYLQKYKDLKALLSLKYGRPSVDTMVDLNYFTQEELSRLPEIEKLKSTKYQAVWKFVLSNDDETTISIMKCGRNQIDIRFENRSMFKREIEDIMERKIKGL